MTADARPFQAPDWVLTLLLALLATCWTWHSTGVDDHIAKLVRAQADDVWFEGDVARVYANMTERLSNHRRTNAHPLFSITALAINIPLQHVLHVSPEAAVRMTIGGISALWLALLFGVLRSIGCRRLDAVLLALVAGTSAGALFWTAVPETYLFGSTTILLTLLVAAWAERRSIPVWLEMTAAAAALSMLLTNWMYALISMVTRRSLRETIQLAINAFFIVTVLWGVEKYLLPSAEFFLGHHEAVVKPKAIGAFEVFFLHSMVMPDALTIPNETAGLWPKFSVQGARSWHLTAWGPIALLVWLALFALGLWALATLQSLGRLRFLLGATLLGQLALHTVFGNETFLYALDWVPTLVLVVALASLTRLRWVVLGLSGIFILTAGIHNHAELESVLRTLAAR